MIIEIRACQFCHRPIRRPSSFQMRFPVCNHCWRAVLERNPGWSPSRAQRFLVIKKSLGGKCFCCGEGNWQRLVLNHAEYHLDSALKSEAARLREALIHPERFVLLCKSCHDLLHRLNRLPKDGRHRIYKLANRPLDVQIASRRFQEKELKDFRDFSQNQSEGEDDLRRRKFMSFLALRKKMGYDRELVRDVRFDDDTKTVVLRIVDPTEDDLRACCDEISEVIQWSGLSDAFGPDTHITLEGTSLFSACSNCNNIISDEGCLKCG